MLDNKFITMSEAQHRMFYATQGLARFRFFGKGRRLGATHGACVFMIDKMLKGHSCLWGDVVFSNIDRYVQRLFAPFLNAHSIPYKFNQQKKLLTVGDGYTDFRSADNPMTWEGFGYDFVFLNEAGIILNDPYLYYNAILPMLMDNPDSQLVAAGTPKLLSGKGKLFHYLYLKYSEGEADFYSETFSTYQNPFLTRKSIEELELQIPPMERKQEIYGEFIPGGGGLVKLEWFGRYRVAPEFKIKIVQSWDTASKAKELNDPSVCTTWLEAENGNVYLLDVHRERMEYPKLKRIVRSLADNYHPDVILIEDKSSGIALIQDLRNDAFPFNLKAVNPTQDKVTRMSTASLTVEAGRVWLPESASWLPTFETEMQEFPESEHDDQVDSVSQFLNWYKSPAEIFIG